jgi:hypothetical protein
LEQLPEGTDTRKTQVYEALVLFEERGFLRPLYPAALALGFGSAVVSSWAVQVHFLIVAVSRSVRIVTFRFVGTTPVLVEALVSCGMAAKCLAYLFFAALSCLFE